MTFDFRWPGVLVAAAYELSGEGCGGSHEAGMAVQIEAALKRLESALDLLEGVIERQIEGALHVASLENELHRLGTDRSELAQSLDAAEARTALLERANREVSQRLVAAMDSIRTMIDGRGH